MVFAMSFFSSVEWMVLLLWFVAIFTPLIYAARTRTSLAMGITVSVLLGAVVQVLWSMLYSWGFVDIWVWNDFVLGVWFQSLIGWHAVVWIILSMWLFGR